jgi:molybdopterin biosynthesis enzyme
MTETIKVGEFATALLELARPLAAFDMPLLDSHGATLALDMQREGEIVLRAGSRLRSTQIALAASLGLDRIPTRPQPRVVVISVGDDLVEPGAPLKRAGEQFEVNSWLLTTAAREAGALSYRIHTIPENENLLKNTIEDQLVRADLLVISGEVKDGSFDLIYRVLAQLGSIKSVQPMIEGSSLHAYGSVGPDKTPVVLLPGDPISAYISHELFIRPMIRSMMGLNDIHRPVLKAVLMEELRSESGKHAFIRGELREIDGGWQVRPLREQGDLMTLAEATGLIAAPEHPSTLRVGDLVDVVVVERRFL